MRCVENSLPTPDIKVRLPSPLDPTVPEPHLLYVTTLLLLLIRTVQKWDPAPLHFISLIPEVHNNL